MRENFKVQFQGDAWRSTKYGKIREPELPQPSHDIQLCSALTLNKVHWLQFQSQNLELDLKSIIQSDLVVMWRQIVYRSRVPQQEKKMLVHNHTFYYRGDKNSTSTAQDDGVLQTRRGREQTVQHLQEAFSLLFLFQFFKKVTKLKISTQITFEMSSSEHAGKSRSSGSKRCAKLLRVCS